MLRKSHGKHRCKCTYTSRVTSHSSLITRHTSQVLLVGYQQVGYMLPLVQELHRTNRLGAMFLNEVQVLDEDANWRELSAIPTFLGNLVRLGLGAVVVFMTATLPNPARTLAICGFQPHFDAAFFVSPMRANLTFQQFLAGGTTGEMCVPTSCMHINFFSQRPCRTR